MCVCVTLSNVCVGVCVHVFPFLPSVFSFRPPESNGRDETKNGMLFRITILDSIFSLVYHFTL